MNPVPGSVTSGQLLPFEVAADYDRLRLTAYASRAECRERIRIARLGESLALRFDDVGYFNRVYSPAGVHVENHRRLRELYRGCPHPCEWLGVDGTAPRSEELPWLGWQPAGRYAWLACDLSEVAVDETALHWHEMRVRPPREHERRAFCETYLRAFEARPRDYGSAVANLLRLFDCPQLHFHMVIEDDRPTAIGMLFRRGHAAMLCAGATLPGRRENGHHGLLIAARLRLARELGCERVVSWAAAGGQSHANLSRMGLETVLVTQAWRHPTLGESP